MFCFTHRPEQSVVRCAVTLKEMELARGMRQEQ